MSAVGAAKLLGLLGLAHRAGRLALGSTAVAKMVAQGKEPVVVIARDAGAGQRRRYERLEPITALVCDVVDRTELARALGRKQLAVVAVADSGFVNGILRLGLPNVTRRDGQGARPTRGAS